MRKFTMFVLLAASAVPALAAAQDEGRRGRQDQSDQSEHNQRPAREARAERSQQNEQRQQMQIERQAQRQQQQGERQAQFQQMQAARQAQVQQIQQQQAQQQIERRQVQLERNDGERGRRLGDGNGGEQGGHARDEQMQQYRDEMRQRRAQAGGQQLPMPRGVVDRDGRDHRVINPNVVGQPAPENRDARFAHRDRDHDNNQWSANNWRHDDRYDWRRYRDHHHSIFRLGFYFDPFGYSYNRFGIGSYMYPSYYQSNYWINDPWQYRLPQAYGPYRWIRYHNDALMIDTWTGEVVDVIYGFFW